MSFKNTIKGYNDKFILKIIKKLCNHPHIFQDGQEH